LRNVSQTCFYIFFEAKRFLIISSFQIGLNLQ
jgi:hypothetical protein